MKKYINMFKIPLLLITMVFLFTFICSLIYYFTGLSYNSLATILLIFIMGFLFVINFVAGRKAESKGYKLGARNGLILVLVFYILGGVLFGFDVTLYKFIYYLILVITCILGSMIGINTKK